MGSRLHWVMMWKELFPESMEGGEIQGSDGALKILRVQGREGEGPARETQQEWEK